MSKSFKEYLDVEWDENRIRLDSGLEMAYCECGPVSGPKLLLIHGVTDGRVSWAQMAPLLSEKGYHCYIVEYRGNGLTDKPEQGEEGYTAELIAADLCSFLEKLELGPIHVVGHSFGSLISQVLACMVPQICKSCTLIDTAVDCRDNPVLLWVRDGDNQEFLGVNHYTDKLPEQFLKEWTETSNEDAGFRQATYEHARGLPLTAWRNLINGLTHFNNWEHIREITQDVLVIWGDQDTIFLKKDQQQVAEGLVSCNARFVIVEGASHNGFWDSRKMAEVYAQHIHRFIREIENQA